VLDTLFRARWLAPALLLIPMGPGLAGCVPHRAETRLAEAQAAVDPPQLWQVTAFDAEGQAIAALKVCADRNMVDGFARADAEVNGQTCLPLKDRVETPGLFAVRCELNGRRFGVTATRAGDPARDFTVAFAVRTVDGGPEGVARQVRRFQALGPCPAEWRLGDQAKAGAPRGVNALAGTWSGE
jgi:hypothetical protein